MGWGAGPRKAATFILPACLPAILLLMVCTPVSEVSPPAGPRPSLIVLTDIGGDPDDMQSLRRLLLYANEFEILGLIATASGTPGEVGRAVTRPDLIAAIVDDYAQVRDNLALHAGGYPTGDSLRRIIRAGSAERGVEHLGAGRSTEGSRHIVRVVEEAAGQVHLTIWGGAHDLAQALWDVRSERSAAGAETFIAKLRIYAIADQDSFGGQPGTGEWIRREFPALRYVESGPPEMNRFTALFRGMYQNDSRGGDHPALALVRPEVTALNQQAWVETHVRSGHGPLGAGYPLVKQNPSSEYNTVGVKEGDTPSWFFSLPNGLSDPEHPGYGGWGGRFQLRGGNHYVDAEDDHWSGTSDEAARRKWTVARWRGAYQNDFAARLDWCVQAYREANHPPRAVLHSDGSRSVLRRQVQAGRLASLSAAGSSDPDGHPLSYRWFVYREPSTYQQPVTIEHPEQAETALQVPRDAAGHSIHVILEVSDQGDPPLRSYRRLILEIP